MYIYMWGKKIECGHNCPRRGSPVPRKVHMPGWEIGENGIGMALAYRYMIQKLDAHRDCCIDQVINQDRVIALRTFIANDLELEIAPLFETTC